MCLSRLDFLVLAHYIRVFYILLKELSNSGKLFSKKSTVLTTPRFFGFLIYLNSLFNSKILITTLGYDFSKFFDSFLDCIPVARRA